MNLEMRLNMIKNVKVSLRGIIGEEYSDAVVRAAVLLNGIDYDTANRIASEEIEFFPEAFEERMNSLLPKVGNPVINPIQITLPGATTKAFKKAENLSASPLGGIGFLRLGEDGRLYLTAKSEHYHTPLGHAFPGYKLIENAASLGINNATHNNTRGHIVRLLEMELVRIANGISRDNSEELKSVLESKERHVLNRVLNLETGSLACEAAMKMMLSRFFRIDPTSQEPIFEGRVPVFFVIADNEGKSTANYHGTTIFAQTLRDLWPSFREKFESEEIIKICPVGINDINDFKRKFAKYNEGKYKAAGFMHEIILMNYGGIKLNCDFLHEIYKICHENETPVMVDEIQSCMWYPGMLLYRQYGLNPDFVILGKGFSGGQYPASRIITTYEMDNLNLFGALVTNGQEELASLSYLITMHFVSENSTHLEEIGQYYFSRLLVLKDTYPDYIEKIEGLGLLASLCFYNINNAIRFAQILNKEAIDISAQTYKPSCPSAVLTKLPVISSMAMVDFFSERMTETLNQMENEIVKSEEKNEGVK